MKAKLQDDPVAEIKARFNQSAKESCANKLKEAIRAYQNKTSYNYKAAQTYVGEKYALDLATQILNGWEEATSPPGLASSYYSVSDMDKYLPDVSYSSSILGGSASVHH